MKINTSVYERVHGQAPRGKSNYLFRIGRRGEIVWFGNLPFQKARRAARRYARVHSVREMNVQA